MFFTKFTSLILVCVFKIHVYITAIGTLYSNVYSFGYLRARAFINAHLLYVHAYNFRSACSRKSGSYQFTRKVDGEFCGDPLAIFVRLELVGIALRINDSPSVSERSLHKVSKIRAKDSVFFFFSANRFPIPGIKDIGYLSLSIPLHIEEEISQTFTRYSWSYF